MRRVCTFAFVVLIAGSSAGHAAAFPDAHEKPPAGWTGPVFKLSQDYPRYVPPPEKGLPWKAYDYATQPEQYIRAVLAYGVQGNLATDWRGYDNAVRKWYHAPWMHFGNSGREFIHGMTRERNSRPRELAPSQRCFWQNWAVGAYNAPGGWVTGQVWRDPDHPDARNAHFPDGTVSVKLLFTAAPESEVPYLKNGFQWQANINPLGAGGCTGVDPSGTRTPATMTLLQIDVAVRDSRNDAATGWVMGTFVYDGNSPGATPWDRMVPVGLQWGNDPDLTPAKFGAGERAKQSWINTGLTIPQHLGWLGRLNGPVDNPISACLSCHGSGQDPALSPMVPPGGSTDAQKLRWFRNVKSGEAFDAGRPENPISLDYSLQLSAGIQNHAFATRAVTAAVANGDVVMTMAKRQETTIFPVSREEGVDEAELIAAAHGTAEGGAATAEQGAAPAATASPAGAAATAAEGPKRWPLIAAGVIGFLLGLGAMAIMRRSG